MAIGHRKQEWGTPPPYQAPPLGRRRWEQKECGNFFRLW